MGESKSNYLSYPSILFISIIAGSFLQAFVPISLFYLFTLLLLSLSWYIGRFKKTASFFSKWRFVIYSLLLITFLTGIRYVFTTIQTFPTTTDDVSEHIYKEKFYENGDSIVILKQDRKWKDNYGNPYKGSFSIREKDYVFSKKEYANYIPKPKNQAWDWGNLYKHLAASDTPRMDLILNEFESIKSTQKLNQLEFAEMVVTFIQDIPYSFVFMDECKTPANYEESIRSILEKCPDCCIGNIPYGVQNPVGFMGNLKGDCDTRTVIIYAILSHFGYDVAILNSDYYAHSILGLNIPAKGAFKTLNGKRYYVWETTNKHFTLGALPNSFGNINHWFIVLTNT